MTASHWILCERSFRWAAALRMAFSHLAAEPPCSPTLVEVRGLSELTSELQLNPNSLVLIEVTVDTLEATLDWLVDAASQGKPMAAIALLDYPRTDVSHCQLFNRLAPARTGGHRDVVASALREAGATDVIDSPRHVGAILATGQRHAKKLRSHVSRQPDGENPFESRAWSLLPWQDTGRSVG